MTNFTSRIIPLLTVLVLSACSEQKQTSEVTEPYFQAADIVTFSPQHSFINTRTYVGEVNAKQQTKLSFEYGGVVEKILVDTSDTVEEGQLLATLNTQLLDIKKQELVAKIKQIDAQLVLNNANLNRVKDLKNKGYGSDQSVDELTAEKAVLLATIEQLNANMSNIDYQINKSAITAPYAATVLQRQISQGDIVASGQPSFNLIGIDEHQIMLGIPFEVAQHLTLNQQLPVEVATRKLTARVVAIGQHINSTNRTVQIRLLLDEPILSNASLLDNLDGQIARIQIDEEIMQSGFWLPLSAITDGVRGQWNILLAEPIAEPISEKKTTLYKLHSATVSIVHTNNNQAFITDLPDQELTIVASGLHRFVPNQTVRNTNSTEQGQ